MAQIVVPWVSTKPTFVCGRSLGFIGLTPRRRSRSTKLGPGSSPRVKKGRVMWRGRLLPRDELHDPSAPSGADLRLPRLVQQDVGRRHLQQVAVLLELPEAVVAPNAQQTADLAGLVVVVDMERLAVLRKVSTDGACIALLRQQFVVFVERQA